jgi:hypothetical protein
MGSYRTKTIKIDNAEFQIGALSLDQVEEYLRPIEPERAEIAGLVKHDALRIRAIEMICNGLNNAQPVDGRTVTDNVWTVTRFKKECDAIIFHKLNVEILQFSGLGVTEEVPGALADAAQTSATSAPAS